MHGNKYAFQILIAALCGSQPLITEEGTGRRADDVEGREA
jgi:hypothetical protein